MSIHTDNIQHPWQLISILFTFSPCCCTYLRTQVVWLRFELIVFFLIYRTKMLLLGDVNFSKSLKKQNNVYISKETVENAKHGTITSCLLEAVLRSFCPNIYQLLYLHWQLEHLCHSNSSGGRQVGHPPVEALYESVISIKLINQSFKRENIDVKIPPAARAVI